MRKTRYESYLTWKGWVAVTIACMSETAAIVSMIYAIEHDLPVLRLFVATMATVMTTMFFIGFVIMLIKSWEM